MTEELKKALTERFEQLSSNVDCDEQVKDALLKACETMREKDEIDQAFTNMMLKGGQNDKHND